MDANRARPVIFQADGPIPENQTSVHSDFITSSNAAIASSGSASTSSETASVIPVPTLPTPSTLTDVVGGYLPAQRRKALEPLMVNSVISTTDETSGGLFPPSRLRPPTQNITPSPEHHDMLEKDGILPFSAPEVKMYSSEELKGLHAFGPGTIALAIHKGLVRKSKATIRFDIPEKHFGALNLWRNRKEHANDLKDSLCLTLSCYSRISVKDETKTLEEVCDLPSVWPTTGDLSMNVMYQGKRTIFPLSPPFIVAPNGLVDVSAFLQSGSNTIELDQFADMSAYIFILRAHRPTGAQLKQVAQRRGKNQAWKEWLDKMSQPFEVPTFGGS